MIELKHENIPAEMKQSARWVRWQLEDVADGDKLRKGAKIPKNARTGANAKHNDPSTFSTYSEALEAHQAARELNADPHSVMVHDRRGIGYVLGPPFFGKDYDKCVIDGVIDPEVQEDLQRIGTYAEFSQSGTGIHAIGHGEAPKNGHRKDDREIYGYNRFFVVTGNIVPGFDKEIRRFTPAETKAEFDRVAAGRPKVEPCGESKLDEYMTKTDFSDLSQAVMSLLTQLMYKHDGDTAKVETEALTSALLTRTHWADKWKRLRETELKKAHEYFVAHPRSVSEFVDSEIEMVMGDEVEIEQLDPLWETDDGVTVLAKGKHHHAQGPSAQGKSPALREIAARVTQGALMPLGAKNGFGDPKCVVIMNLEDDIADTMVPEMKSYGADMSRVGFITMTRVTKKKRGESNEEYVTRLQFALDRDLEALRRKIQQLEARFGKGCVGMIIIDPVTSHLGKAAMNKEEDVRNTLGPFVEMAREFHLVSITVGHLNKSDSTDQFRRGMGAAAFLGMARLALSFGPDKEGGGDPYRHIMALIRGAVKGDSFRYHTERHDFEYTTKDGVKKTTKVIRVVWDGRSKQNAEESAEHTSRKELSHEQEAGIELRNFLKAGKRPAQDCQTFLKSAGFKVETMNVSRMRRGAGVSHKTEGGKNWWFLPTAQHEMEIPTARQKDGAPNF